jgi:CRP-like cAMP-binding protein
MDMLKEAETLRNVPLFAKLDPSKLKLLAFTSQSLTFESGEILFREGDAADAAYVILAGEIEIVGENERGSVVYGTLGPNALVGELAVFTNSTRTATLRAKGRLQVLRIADEKFIKLVTENPEVTIEVLRQLSEKLARTHRQVEALQDELRRGGP